MTKPNELNHLQTSPETGQGVIAERLPRVQITKREHPHFEEYGRFTGKVIRMIWGAQMAEVKLEHCRHGTDGCFVSVGDVRQVPER